MSLTIFSTNYVQSLHDGSATLTIYGINNDTDRSGFRVQIVPTTEDKLHPAKALNAYIDRPDDIRPKDKSLLSLTLQAPYKIITSQTVSKHSKGNYKVSWVIQ